MCMRARFLAGRDMSIGKTEQPLNSSWKTPSGDRDVVLNKIMHTASSVSQPTAADASNFEGPYCGTGTDCTAQWRACSLASCALRSESGPKFDPCFMNGCAELVSSVWHRNGAIFLISQRIQGIPQLRRVDAHGSLISPSRTGKASRRMCWTTKCVASRSAVVAERSQAILCA